MILAESAGFCFGVERAVKLVEHELGKGVKPLYTYGPIIHNETVVEAFKARGVEVIEDIEGLRKAAPGTIVTRAHGTKPQDLQIMRDLGYTVIDGACPIVRHIHELIARASAAGKGILIVGDAGHPEVQAACGWSSTGARVIGEKSDFPLRLPLKSYFLVAQTTFNTKKFEEIVEKLEATEYNIDVVNTICNATQTRQTEAASIAARVDSMIVIGGRNSSNTQKLYEVCKAQCRQTYLIQTLADLIELGFQPDGSVGITAGASTPKNLIEEVHTYVRSKF